MSRMWAGSWSWRAAASVGVALAMLASCGESIDTAGLPATDNYTSWHRIDVEGSVPGHGDTYRIIYVNAIARDYSGAGEYPPGSVIVKEIREPGSADGALRYVAIMRKLDEAGNSTVALQDEQLDDAWLFTRASSAVDVGANESRFAYCWDSCHAQAPIDGAFYDYSR